MKTTKEWSKILLAGMAALVLAFGLIAVGCGDSGGDDDNTDGGGTVPAELRAEWYLEQACTTKQFELTGSKLKVVGAPTEYNVEFDGTEMTVTIGILDVSSTFGWTSYTLVGKTLTTTGAGSGLTGGGSGIFYKK